MFDGAFAPSGDGTTSSPTGCSVQATGAARLSIWAVAPIRPAEFDHDWLVELSTNVRTVLPRLRRALAAVLFRS